MSTELTTEIADPARFRCRHVFTDGRRCGSPALRTQPFCYYHHNARTPIPRRELLRRRQFADVANAELPPHELPAFTLPAPADLTERSGIQHTIALVLSRIAANDLDPRRAGLLLYGLQIASMNLPKREPEPDVLETVEDLTDDPIHGPIAPPAEFIPQPKWDFASLLEDPDDDPEEDHPADDDPDEDEEEPDDEERADDDRDHDDDLYDEAPNHDLRDQLFDRLTSATAPSPIPQHLLATPYPRAQPQTPRNVSPPGQRCTAARVE